ncbi:MAG: GxxExxY protein, partial [Acidobacteria bacterium]|nr:GxxExxY protein [Acidobacteriota bacterium]
FLEKVYQRALLHELRLRGIRAAAEVSFPVTYKGHGVGEYFADQGQQAAAPRKASSCCARSSSRFGTNSMLSGCSAVSRPIGFIRPYGGRNRQFCPAKSSGGRFQKAFRPVNKYGETYVAPDTLFRRMPMPSISTSTTSPGFILAVVPGVPVKMRSPGISVT